MARLSERVLITGSSGLTGRLLLERLQEEGVAVFGMRRSPKQDWEVRGDLNDPESLHEAVRRIQPSHVLHLGGITFPAHSDQTEIYQTNVTGTAALLTALKDLSAPAAVILASSATIYAPPVDDRPISESAPLLPNSHYAVSKLTIEHMARLFSPHLPILVTRPFNYTGAGQPSRFLIPKIVDHFARGERTIELGQPRPLSRFFRCPHGRGGLYAPPENASGRRYGQPLFGPQSTSVVARHRHGRDRRLRDRGEDQSNLRAAGRAPGDRRFNSTYGRTGRPPTFAAHHRHAAVDVREPGPGRVGALIGASMAGKPRSATLRPKSPFVSSARAMTSARRQGRGR